jgi:hypothetical protein
VGFLKLLVFCHVPLLVSRRFFSEAAERALSTRPQVRTSPLALVFDYRPEARLFEFLLDGQYVDMFAILRLCHSLWRRALSPGDDEPVHHFEESEMGCPLLDFILASWVAGMRIMVVSHWRCRGQGAC